MQCCLNGVRVLELARHQAGPRAGMILSDLGAEVIKVEKPGGEETRRSGPFVGGQSVYFSTYNRGKKSLCLNLRREEGKAVFFDLLKSTDIVIENFKPGTLESMGLGYEELVKTRPDIILARVSGFGQRGPYSGRPGFDPIGQAMSGLMSLNGLGASDGKPIGTAFSVVDRMTALHVAIGMLAALRHRDETGTGQVIDVCLMDIALTMTEIPTAYFLATGEQGGESGRPPYEAKDGWVVIAAGSNERLVKHVAETAGLDLRTANLDRNDNGGSFFAFRIPELAQWCRKHTVAEICEHFLKLGVPAAPVLTIPEVAKDAHLWEREMLVAVNDRADGEMYVPGLSIKFSRTPGKIGPVPEAGQHSEELLRDLLGYDAMKIAALKASAIV
ncbi:MAG: CaiB/BaiF CoA transferase family protein [Burkholderiaceae bacterium]